jgi:hypothetical protein
MSYEKKRADMKEVRMRKDFFCYGEYGGNNKIRQADLKMQAKDTNRALIIEQKRRSDYAKI